LRTPDPIDVSRLEPRAGQTGLDERFGHFNPETREYIITRPDTPQPWHNYMTNGTFTGYVSNTGGGTCFFDDPKERRILRTHLHGRPADEPGRWIYIRDRETGVFHSATWAPVRSPLSRFKYQCQMAPGFTGIAARCNGVQSRVTYFVPPDANCEIWWLAVTNVGKKTRRLDLFPYAEFFQWSLERDNNLDSTSKCTDVAAFERMILHRSYYDFGEERGGWQRQFAYFASSEKPKSFDANIEAFVGVHQGYDRPRAVVEGRCSNFVNRGGEPVAAMQIPVTLKPGQKKTLMFAVGYALSEAAAKRDARRVTQASFVTRQFKKMESNWEKYLSHFQAETGEPAFDASFNTWVPYQSAMTFLLSRSISPYQLNGARGLGFRDSNQDALGAMPHQPPEKTRGLISQLLFVQKPSGEASHGFQPGPGVGVGGDHWDDQLWPALSAEWYVKESGDLGFLDQELPYQGGKKPDTVLDHLERGMRFTERNLGANGLPLLGRADWNDCLNAFEGAESVFDAGLYCAAARSMADLHRVRGDERSARRCERRHATMAERMNAVAWDGEWYSRLITREGDVIGSHRNRYGKIFIESNVWAVLGAAAPPDRARVALDSVRKYLGTPLGHRLCWPAYPAKDMSVGTITIFAPGFKENGSIFCHCNPWLVVAEAMLGRGERAFDIYRRISGWEKDRIQSVHCAEPYVVSQMITMPPNREVGRARNPWLTGTAAWVAASMGRGILGVRPDFNGLVVDPCVPRWRKFRIRRIFRGITFDIHVDNPDRVEWGVQEITVAGGKTIPGSLIPLDLVAGRKTVRVNVRMG
jgi:cellobiose phosphorylase